MCSDTVSDPAVDNRVLFESATRVDRLEEAWERVRLNQGAAGGDGETVAAFAASAAVRLVALQRDLRDGRYEPGPVRRVDIPKRGGGLRPLAIPCVVDRVAQGAVALTLGPVLDPEFSEASFGYRPGRSVEQAVARVRHWRDQGYRWVVDGDIERYFERVPHDPLLARIAAHIGDGPLTRLVALWLETAAPAGCGLPQGSPLSPLLANLYLDTVDDAISGRGVRLVRFADDFVLLCRERERAEAALSRIADVLAHHGLGLNPDKTRLVSFEQGFRFLGRLFLRSLDLPSPNREQEDEDDAEAMLRRLAGEDAAAARDAGRRRDAEEAERAAGYDRVLRVLYLGEPGRRLSIRNQAFAVEEKAEDASGGGDGWREIAALPAQRIDRIELGPAVEATMTALRHALAMDVPLAFVNGHGETAGVLATAALRHGRRHLDQARHTLDPAARTGLARRLVDGRVRNQRALLRRLNRERKEPEVVRAVLGLNRILAALEAAPDVPALLGHEGAAAALYWPAWGRLLAAGWSFDARRRRPPPDPVNAALSFLAALLERDLAAILMRHGLHPAFGALHSAQDGHDACVYDLMEEFRAPLVEGLALYLINNRILKPAMFETLAEGRCRIARPGAEALIRGWEGWLDRPVKSPRHARRVLWRRLIEEQAVAYAAHVGGGAAYRPYVMDY